MTLFETEVEFSPPAAMLAFDFRSIGSRIKSFREPLQRAVREVMQPSFRRNFDVGGRPTWARLSDKTVAAKGYLGFSDVATEPLVRTGLLQQVAGQLNIWSFSSDAAWIANLPRAKYGAVHQDGEEPYLPARPWAVIQPEDLDAIDIIFQDWLRDIFQEHGFDN